MIDFRRINETDLPNLFTWRNDPSVYNWCRQISPLHWDCHLAWYRRQAQDPKLDMFVVCNELGQPIGVCGLTDIDLVNSRAEFSLYIAPEHMGKGRARPTLAKLLAYGFDTLGLNRIYCETFEHNHAQKLFESLGMELEGIRREFYFRNGRFINAKLYSINAANFRAHESTKNCEI